MKLFPLLTTLILSSLLVACGGDGRGPELPLPDGSSSSSESSSSEQSSSEQSSSSEESSSSSSSSEPALEVAWNIFDGNNSPFASGNVTLADGTTTAFELGGNEAGMAEQYFTVVGDGTVDLDTSAEPGHQHYAQLSNIVANDGVYPKYFTLIAGITGPAESSRVIDIEIAMADDGVSGSRLKAVIRADGNNTGVQLERATNGGQDSSDSVQNYDLDMLDVFRIYHFAIELTSAERGNVHVYVDGDDEPLANLALEDVLMRPTSGAGDNFLRFGDGGGSAYQANIDWLVWTDEAAYTPAELTRSLPSDIGCINGYGVTACGDSGEGSSSSSSSSSAHSLPDITSADYDFENDTVGAYPDGFNSSIEAYIQVTDEIARLGTKSARLTRLNVGENVNLRRPVTAADTGSFKVSVFLPDNVPEGLNSYLTLWDGSYTALTGRVADLVLGYDGTLQNRARTPDPGNAQGPLVPIEGVTFHLGVWNDFEMSWSSISTSGEYTLSINGVVVGTYEAEYVGRVPNRFEIKYGASNSPADPTVSLFVDAISAF